MAGIRFRKTSGAHTYRGFRNSRAKRTMSKLHKGIKFGDVEKAFKAVEEERREQSQCSFK